MEPPVLGHRARTGRPFLFQGEVQDREKMSKLILYVALSLELIAAHFLEISVSFQRVPDFDVSCGKFARQSLQIGTRKIAHEAA